MGHDRGKLLQPTQLEQAVGSCPAQLFCHSLLPQILAPAPSGTPASSAWLQAQTAVHSRRSPLASEPIRDPVTTHAQEQPGGRRKDLDGYFQGFPGRPREFKAEDVSAAQGAPALPLRCCCCSWTENQTRKDFMAGIPRDRLAPGESRGWHRLREGRKTSQPEEIPEPGPLCKTRSSSPG